MPAKILKSHQKILQNFLLVKIDIAKVLFKHENDCQHEKLATIFRNLKQLSKPSCLKYLCQTKNFP